MTIEDVILLDEKRRKVRFYYVEMYYFLFYIGHWLFCTVSSNFVEILYCQHKLNVSEEKCFNSSYVYMEKAQKFVATFTLLHNCFMTFSPILLLFIGPWSDIHGRKLLISIPTLGYLVSIILWMWASVVQPSINPWLLVFFLLPFYATGNATMITFAVYCCVSDVTKEANRSYRLGLLQVCILLSELIGSIILTLVLHLGYQIVLATVAVSMCLALVQFNVFFKETTSSQVVQMSKRWCTPSKSCFQFEYIRGIINFYYKQTLADREIISLITVIRFLYTLAETGNNTVRYLFLQWTIGISLLDYAIYQSFTNFVHLIAVIFGNWYLKEFNDLHVLMIITLMEVLSLPSYIFFGDIKYIYLSSVMNSLQLLFSSFCKSVSSKIVGRDDIGKVLAISDLGGVIGSIIGVWFYTIVYQLTLSNYASLVYVCSLIIYFLVLILLLRVHQKMNNVVALPIK